MSENSLTAGVWCAPSKLVYDIESLKTNEFVSPVITLPFEVSARRGCIRYNTEPETNEAKAQRKEHEEATRIWRLGLPGTEVGQVWLAIRDDGYDGDVLLEVCTSPARARAACQHDATDPRRGWTSATVESIDWDTKDWGPSRGWAGSRYYRVERKPLMA